MQASEFISDFFFFWCTLLITYKMPIYLSTIDDVAIVEKIIRSPTLKFEHVVCSIEQSNDIDKTSLLVHEKRIKKRVEAVQQALQSQLSINSKSPKNKDKGKLAKHDDDDSDDESNGCG